jgi:hypothetical protein
MENVRRLLLGEIGGYQVGIVRVILRQLSGFQRGIRQIPLTKVELHDPVLGVGGINPIVRRRGDDRPVCLDDVVDIAPRALGCHGLGNEYGGRLGVVRGRKRGRSHLGGQRCCDRQHGGQVGSPHMLLLILRPALQRSASRT